MDLSSLLPLLSGLGPWGVAIGVGVTILIQRLGIKIPTLPTLPTTPTAPVNPALPTDPKNPIHIDPLGFKDRPLLNLILGWMALKSSGSVTAADAPFLDLLHREIGEVKANVKSLQQ